MLYNIVLLIACSGVRRGMTWIIISLIFYKCSSLQILWTRVVIPNECLSVSLPRRKNNSVNSLMGGTQKCWSSLFPSHFFVPSSHSRHGGRRESSLNGSSIIQRTNQSRFYNRHDLTVAVCHFLSSALPFLSVADAADVFHRRLESP